MKICSKTALGLILFNLLIWLKMHSSTCAALPAVKLWKCFLSLGSVSDEGGKLGRDIINKGSGGGYQGDKLESP